MRNSARLIVGSVGVAVVGVLFGAALADDFPLVGNYTQNVACKGDVSDQAIAKGVLQDETTIAKAMQRALDGVTTQIDSFAANTLEFLRHEVDLLTSGIQLPELGTSMDGKHVLVVVRGYSLCTPTPTATPPEWPACSPLASTQSRSRPRAPARTWRCSSPTPAAPA